MNKAQRQAKRAQIDDATISIQGKRFVPKGKLADTLFLSGGTADGEYKRLKNGVMFYKPDGQPFLFLVMNKHGERFFVSCHRVDGRTRYMFAVTDATRDYMEFPDSYKAEQEIAHKVAAEFETR